MRTNWLIRGLIVFLFAGLGWFVSVILNVVSLGQFRVAANVLGVIAVSSIPVSIALMIIDRRKQIDKK